MAANSKIEWTDDTNTPIRARAIVPTDDGAGKERVGWHCEHVSPGCRNCYAEGMNRRLGTGYDYKPAHLVHEIHFAHGTREARGEVTLFLDEKMLLAPLRRGGNRMVFPCSMTDLFARFVFDEWIDKMFAVMALTPHHTYQVLTKRADRMAAYLTAEGTLERILASAQALIELHWKREDKRAQARAALASRSWPLANVWTGVSVEDQQRADERLPHTRALARAGWTTWVSYEPALELVDWRGWESLDWMVSGGESGPGARPTHPTWHRAARDFCERNGVSYSFKQWGAWAERSQLPPAHHTELLRPRPQHCFEDGTIVERLGKANTGRLLDGLVHDDQPARSPVANPCADVRAADPVS